MGAAFATAVGLAAITLAVSDFATTALGRALCVTTRFSFLLFWVTYTGGALKTLFGVAFQPVAWRGRDFGLAFAAAHLVNIGLFVWLCRISAQPPLSPPVFWFLAIGTIWIYVVALLSIRRLARAIGYLRWRMLRVAGMEYISLTFLLTFVGHRLHGSASGILLYVPFATLSLAGSFLRLTAWASRGAIATKRA
ncbi:hypothetical protein CCS01_06900 [Rhodopila globiformis]|uniref:Ferric oxidoreductase domain-containing protein n=2 Tax=Rhodopila globiformis TaxID=1071 RepID=A0A2S6NKH6_RHOGL|nr:hypothetical protein CCS01_06900 [Rhodopila globiformis]